MRLLWTDGTPLLLLTRPQGETILDARTLQPAALEPGRLVRAAARLVPLASIEEAEWLTAPDAYWYRAKGSVELPMLRVRFADRAGTWVHISPRSGALLDDMDARRRLYRWLFDALHRWDLHGLIDRRPLWDLWMWIWLVSGTIVSVSGTILAFGRMGLPDRKTARSIGNQHG